MISSRLPALWSFPCVHWFIFWSFQGWFRSWSWQSQPASVEVRWCSPSGKIWVFRLNSSWSFLWVIKYEIETIYSLRLPFRLAGLKYLFIFWGRDFPSGQPQVRKPTLLIFIDCCYRWSWVILSAFIKFPFQTLFPHIFDRLQWTCSRKVGATLTSPSFQFTGPAPSDKAQIFNLISFTFLACFLSFSRTGFSEANLFLFPEARFHQWVCCFHLIVSQSSTTSLFAACSGIPSPFPSLAIAPISAYSCRWG